MNFELETHRLIMKIENEHSYKQVLEFYSRNRDFELYEPTRINNFYTPQYQKASLAFEYNSTISKHLIRFYLYSKNNPSYIIGSLCFSNIIRGSFNSASIGYKIDKSYRKMGYAYEACKKGIQLMFNDYNLHRIEAKILPTNQASINLINKLGFVFEGTEYKSVEINHTYEDHFRYALINNNYRRF